MPYCKSAHDVMCAGGLGEVWRSRGWKLVGPKRSVLLARVQPVSCLADVSCYYFPLVLLPFLCRVMNNLCLRLVA